LQPIENPRGREIRVLQYGRGVAALLVCLFHNYGLIDKYFGGMGWGKIFHAGHSGVEFFFILSGFIIFHAHRQDIGNPQNLKTFLYKRAIRILPMFWLVALPLGLLFLLTPVFGMDRDLTGGNLLIDLLLVPREGILTLPPAWTLQHEVVFYLIFTLMIASRMVGIIALGLWQAVCILVVVFSLHDSNYLLPINKLIGVHNLGFGVGIGIAVFFASPIFRAARSILLTGGAMAAVGLVGMFVGEWIIGPKLFGGGPALVLTYFTVYTLLILGLLSIRQREFRALDATLGILGSSSYVLYLTHAPVASIINKLCGLPVLQPIMGPGIAYTGSVLACVVAAIAIHFFLERPVIKWLKLSLIARRRLRPVLAG
jgi:exopolysaccharide production protein ExoZ